jgi:hypothetical protein
MSGLLGKVGTHNNHAIPKLWFSVSYVDMLVRTHTFRTTADGWNLAYFALVVESDGTWDVRKGS